MGIGMTNASVRIAVAISLATWGAAAQAQVAAPAASTAGSGDALQEIIVTAQRRAQNLEDVPVSVQVISNRALESAGIKSTQDLGQITPNVTIISPIGQGNQPLITIRGIGLNDFDTNNAGPNGVYIDDVYINAPSAQSFALFDLQGIQILKGPQGTLYGRNTRGGALRVHLQPSPRMSTRVICMSSMATTIPRSWWLASGARWRRDLTGRISLVVNRSDELLQERIYRRQY